MRKFFVIVLVTLMNTVTLQGQSVTGNLEGIILDSEGNSITDFNVIVTTSLES